MKPDTISLKLGVFTCIRKLGSGATSIVYLAYLSYNYNKAKLPKPVNQLIGGDNLVDNNLALEMG